MQDQQGPGTAAGPRSSAAGHNARQGSAAGATQGACLQAQADAVLQGVLNEATLPVSIADLEAKKKNLNAERKQVAKEIAKEKRKRKRILEKTRALTEDEMAREIIARRLRAAARDSAGGAHAVSG